MVKIELREDLSEFFKPVTETQKEMQEKTQKAITKGLEPIKTGIEELPQKLPRDRSPFLKPLTILKRPPTSPPPASPPPAYSLPTPSTSKKELKETTTKNEVFQGSDIKFGIYEKAGEHFIGNKFSEPIDNYKYIIIGNEKYLNTPGLNELLTKKDPDIENIPANDISMYSKILVETNTMYVNDDPNTDQLKSVRQVVEKTDKWNYIILPTWNNMQEKKKRAGKKGKKTGKGLKKVVIPSDPNSLLEKLNLLMARKAAGNTGVRNELMSVCDELKRQGVFDSNIYKTRGP